MKCLTISKAFLALVLIGIASAADSAKENVTTTASPSSLVDNRKDRSRDYMVPNGRGLLGNFVGSSTKVTGSGASGSGGGGGNALQVFQQGLKGIQSIQKFVSNLGGVMKLPFSFRGVSDTMATITGLLAAVGGGYLTYVSMVALFGNAMDPHGAYTDPQAAFFAPGQGQAFGPIHAGYSPQAPAAAESAQQPFRRQSNGGLYFGSMDLGKFYNSVKNFDYPEASFKMLRIKDEVCKHRAVCELEKYLAKKGIASVILKGVSKKITGMERYLDAAYRGLSNEDCAFVYSSCPNTLGQTLLRSVGLS